MDTCEKKHTRRLSLTLILWDICFVREAVHAQQKDDLRIEKQLQDDEKTGYSYWEACVV